MTTLAVDTTTSTGSFTVDAQFEATTGITALFGPSGSGKSVTLATVAGLLRPVRGSVTLEGRVVADPAHRIHIPTQQRRIGMVFQHAALLPHRTPLDNVALAVRDQRRRRARRARARHLLDRVQAGHLAAAPTHTLSGGERQRVAFARALAGRPRLLLLDEPFSALDQANRVALRHLLRALVDDDGITALLVTHDLDDVATLADRVVRYEPGRTTSSHRLDPGTPGSLAGLLGLDAG